MKDEQSDREGGILADEMGGRIPWRRKQDGMGRDGLCCLMRAAWRNAPQYRVAEGSWRHDMHS